MRGFTFSFLLLLSSLALAKESNYRWPTKEWAVSLPEAAGIDDKEFERFLNYTFPENLNWSDRKGVRTEGLLVIKDGLVIYEKYQNGFGPDKRHLLWSTSKLLGNALVAVLERKNILKRSDLVAPLIQSDRPDEFKDLKIQDLLYWSSGLSWSEKYEWNPLRSSVLAMLYAREIPNLGKYVASFPLSHQPGHHESYSSGDTNLLSYAIRSAIKDDQKYWDLPWKEIFDPIGIKSAVIERDESGTFVLSSYAQMTPRDLAKLGLLYLNDGVWNGTRIFPKGWVFDSTRLSQGFRKPAKGSHSNKPLHGMHLWTNREDLERNLRRPFPDVPSDMFAAFGHWGQGLFILPSQRLIVVRMADDRDESFDVNRFLKLLLNSTTSSLADLKK